MLSRSQPPHYLDSLVGLQCLNRGFLWTVPNAQNEAIKLVVQILGSVYLHSGSTVVAIARSPVVRPKEITLLRFAWKTCQESRASRRAEAIDSLDHGIRGVANVGGAVSIQPGGTGVQPRAKAKGLKFSKRFQDSTASVLLAQEAAKPQPGHVEARELLHKRPWGHIRKTRVVRLLPARRCAAHFHGFRHVPAAFIVVGGESASGRQPSQASQPATGALEGSMPGNLAECVSACERCSSCVEP